MIIALAAVAAAATLILLWRAVREVPMGGYQLAVGAAALPAGLAFGFLWSWIGPPGAILAGAGIAGLAVVLLFVAVEGDRPTRGSWASDALR